MKQGSTRITIPERTELRCEGCVRLKRGSMLSGRNYVYTNNCTHPNAPDIRALYGNIGDNARTPDWCPYLKKRK
jgi:hypothetical protein